MSWLAMLQEITRVWGPIGLFWALLLEQLEVDVLAVSANGTVDCFRGRRPSAIQRMTILLPRMAEESEGGTKSPQI
jgi:hypothetical protein